MAFQVIVRGLACVAQWAIEPSQESHGVELK